MKIFTTQLFTPIYEPACARGVPRHELQRISQFGETLLNLEDENILI